MTILRHGRPVVDHVFICTDPGAPAAERLVGFGLQEGARNSHPGQGTANRRFFFRSTMLELLWVADAVEAQNERTRPTLLWERWNGRRSGACPFGIVLRPTRTPAEPPFPSWRYTPEYLPAGVAMHIASASGIAEPMWVYTGLAREQSRDVGHPAGLNDITRVGITSPNATESALMQSLAGSGLISFARGEEYLLELGFDREADGRAADFRPDLPLVFRW